MWHASLLRFWLLSLLCNSVGLQCDRIHCEQVILFDIFNTSHFDCKYLYIWIFSVVISIIDFHSLNFQFVQIATHVTFVEEVVYVFSGLKALKKKKLEIFVLPKNSENCQNDLNILQWNCQLCSPFLMSSRFHFKWINKLSINAAIVKRQRISIYFSFLSVFII